MLPPDLDQRLRAQFCALVELEADDRGGYEVRVPFFFDDGDALYIRLAEIGGRLTLTDEGNTLMRLSYQMSPRQLFSGTRKQLLDTTLLHYGVELREGRLMLPVSTSSVGQSLADFIQAILKVSDLTFLTHDRTSSTFLDDFRAIVSSIVPDDRLEFQWSDPIRDPRGDFYADARVNHMAEPLMIFAVTTTERALHAATNILLFREWQLTFRPVVVYEDVEKVSEAAKKKVAKVSPTRFDDFYAQRTQFENYIASALRHP